MPIKNGDFVLANYTLKVKESGDIVDTTLESVAKEKGIHHEHHEHHEHEGTEETDVHQYEPLFIVVGEGWVTKGFDEGLVGLDVGKSPLSRLLPTKDMG